jgi:hypothetical protein
MPISLPGNLNARIEAEIAAIFTTKARYELTTLISLTMKSTMPQNRRLHRNASNTTASNRTYNRTALRCALITADRQSSTRIDKYAFPNSKAVLNGTHSKDIAPD